MARAGQWHSASLPGLRGRRTPGWALAPYSSARPPDQECWTTRRTPATGSCAPLLLKSAGKSRSPLPLKSSADTLQAIAQDTFVTHGLFLEFHLQDYLLASRSVAAGQK